MRSMLRRPTIRIGLWFVGVVGCAIGADALAIIIVHGSGSSRHICWICDPNPPPGQECQLGSATHVLTCSDTSKCAYCGWANGSPTMSCGECNNSFDP